MEALKTNNPEQYQLKEHQQHFVDTITDIAVPVHGEIENHHDAFEGRRKTLAIGEYPVTQGSLSFIVADKVKVEIYNRYDEHEAGLVLAEKVYEMTCLDGEKEVAQIRLGDPSASDYHAGDREPWMQMTAGSLDCADDSEYPAGLYTNSINALVQARTQ